MTDADVPGRSSASLRFSGRLDAGSTIELDRLLKEQFDAGVTSLVVDLGEVSYVSTSVLRSLLLAHRRQERRGGELTLINIPPRIRRILTLCGFDRVFVLDSPASN